MKYFGIILSLVGVLLVLCSGNQKTGNDLRDTTWISVIGEGYADTLSFADSTYMSYSAELGSRFYGTYNTSVDTVKLIEGGEYVVFDNSFHPFEEPVKLYLVNKGGKLYYIKRYIKKDNRWVDSGYEFDNQYYFTKLEAPK